MVLHACDARPQHPTLSTTQPIVNKKTTLTWYGFHRILLDSLECHVTLHAASTTSLRACLERAHKRPELALGEILEMAGENALGFM